jgi:hypothetical protein
VCESIFMSIIINIYGDFNVFLLMILTRLIIFNVLFYS